jgi:PAS domain S-box-containing protein
MTLRRKTLLAVGLTYVALAAVLVGLLSGWVLQGFRRLELDATREDVVRARQALELQVAGLDATVLDWGEFDDSYEFMRSLSPAYVTANLNDETLVKLGLRLVAYFDPGGRLVYGAAVDPLSGRVERTPARCSVCTMLPATLVTRTEQSPASSGILLLPDGPVLVSARAIRTSAGGGPSRGALVMARPFGPDQVRALGANLELSVATERLDGTTLPDDFRSARERLGGEEITTGLLAGDRIAGYTLVRDVESRPALILRVDARRRIYEHGRVLVRSLVVILALAALLFGGLAMLVVERLVLARVTRLDRGVSRIAALGSPTERVEASGSDELGRLGTGINRMLEALASSEKELRLVAHAVRSVGECVSITNREDRILFVNEAFLRTYGYEPEELLGRPIDIVKPAELVSPTQPATAEVRTGTLAGGWQGEIVNRRKDGTEFPVYLSTSVVRDEHGEAIGLVGVATDVTERRRMEAQLRHSQKIEAVGRLAGGVAHDFNNLLQTLLSHTQLIRDHAREPERVLELTAELERHAKRGAALSRQLLVFSRRDTARTERVDLGRTLEETAAMLRPVVRENVKFSVEVGGEELPVDADRGQLEQVITNLVVNAAHAMLQGGRLTLGAGCDGEDGVWVAVEDSGAGIPEEIRDRIFEPFFTTKAPSEGSGLGLSVVHGIVTQHGGRVEVSSTVGRGSRFKVVLPRSVAGDTPPAAEPSSPSAPIEAGMGERVVVVEDEEGTRVGLRLTLTRLGYQVVAVGSAEEADRLADEPSVDLLLTDLILPGMSGAELARRLVHRWPGLRVILMSGYTEDETVRRGAAAGTVRFLQKPFDMATLAHEMRAALREPPSSLGLSAGTLGS